KRIVANIATERVEDDKAFYADILGLNLVMDLGWILTFAGGEAAAPQISIATEGGQAPQCQISPSRSIISMRSISAFSPQDRQSNTVPNASRGGEALLCSRPFWASAQHPCSRIIVEPGNFFEEQRKAPSSTCDPSITGCGRARAKRRRR